MGRIKQFLKSDWRKVIIFLIIYLFFPYPVFIHMEFIGSAWYFIPFTAPLMFEASILNILSGLDLYSPLDYFMFFMGLFFPIIVYFLSCLIIFTYDKLKKKKFPKK